MHCQPGSPGGDFANVSSEIKELRIPSNRDEMSKAIYIRHNGVYLTEYWRLNQILEHGTQGAQLRLGTETLNPKESINWRFSISDLVDDMEAYNSLESYQRMRISFSFPMAVSLTDGSILSREAITIRWIKD